MEIAKILNNIEPFNDLYFKSCFFNSFFPVANYFSKDITAYLVNDRVSYLLNDNQELEVKYSSIESPEHIMKRQGFLVEKGLAIRNVIHRIIKAIEADRPVIIWSDYYYNPLRTDMYQKQHGEHTLLVYGFDEVNKSFHILEHTNRDSLNYSKQIISFQDLEMTYNAYCAANLMNISYFEFYLDESVQTGDMEDYFQRYKEYLASEKEEAAASSAAIIKYLGCLADRCNEDYSQINVMNVLNSIINAKKVEKYTLGRIDEDGKLKDHYLLIKELVDQWSLIRTLIYKKYNSNNVDESFGRKVRMKLKELQLLEKTYFNYIFSI